MCVCSEKNALNTQAKKNLLQFSITCNFKIESIYILICYVCNR